jgi:hypothetical protein
MLPLLAAGDALVLGAVLVWLAYHISPSVS